MSAPEPVSSAEPDLAERPHPLTPFIRGWVVLLAMLVAVGRELVARAGEARFLPPLELLGAGLLVVTLVAALAGLVSWRFTRFVVDARQLRIDTGVLFHRSQRIAFDKLQAIDVAQPFAARLFGLAELQLDVGAPDRPRLRYLSRARAYSLRDYLLARASRAQTRPGEQPAPAPALVDRHAGDEVLATIGWPTLLLAAVTAHEFWAIGLAAAATTWLTFTLSGQPWLLLGIALPTASALWAFTTGRVTRQFNYTLSRRPHGLRISRGLFGLTSQSLPARRVQAVQLSQSPAWRALGLYRVDVGVIGWGTVTEDEDTSGVSTILLPAATIEQVRVALAAIWPRADFEAVALAPVPARAGWLHPLARPFLRSGHDGELVVTRHGWLVRRWQLVPLARIQSVRVAQGPLARRLGLARLDCHTAGGIRATAPALDAGLAARRQADLARLVRQRPQLDPAEAQPSQAAGPAALLADQAEATISSTE